VVVMFLVEGPGTRPEQSMNRLSFDDVLNKIGVGKGEGKEKWGGIFRFFNPVVLGSEPHLLLIRARGQAGGGDQDRNTK